MVDLFKRVWLRMNMIKTKCMTCVLGKIRTRLSDSIYQNSREGLSTRDKLQDRNVECDICGVELAEASLAGHLESQHDVYRSKVIAKDLLIE